MKIGDLLNTLAGKINQQNNKALVDVLSRADVSSVDIPDEFANQLVSDLLSLEGAKNNSTVKSHFTALALKSMDKEISDFVNELGIEDDIFSAEKDTFNKMRVLPEKVKELIEKKGGNGKDKAEYEVRIKELNDKMAKIIEDHKSEVSNINTQHSNEVLDWHVLGSLRGKNYANKDISEDVNIKLAKTLLSEAMNQKGVKLVNDNGALKLKTSKDDMDYYDENHKPIGYEDFVAQILSENKLLAVSDPTKVTPTTVQPPVTITSSGNPTQNTEKFDSAMNQAMADLK